MPMARTRLACHVIYSSPLIYQSEMSCHSSVFYIYSMHLFPLVQCILYLAFHITFRSLFIAIFSCLRACTLTSL